MCIQRTVGVGKTYTFGCWCAGFDLIDSLINSPSRWEISLSSSCARTIPTWWSSFAFLGFEMDIKRTPTTSVDPRVQYFRIRGNFPSYGISGDFPPFRRSIIPLFHNFFIPTFRVGPSIIFIELFSSSLDNGANIISCHRHCKFKSAYRQFSFQQLIYLDFFTLVIFLLVFGLLACLVPLYS